MGHIDIWVFPKIGGPQNGWFIMENPIKMDNLGGVPPIFRNIHIFFISRGWILSVNISCRIPSCQSRHLLSSMPQPPKELCSKSAPRLDTVPPASSSAALSSKMVSSCRSDDGKAKCRARTASYNSSTDLAKIGCLWVTREGRPENPHVHQFLSTWHLFIFHI